MNSCKLFECIIIRFALFFMQPIYIDNEKVKFQKPWKIKLKIFYRFFSFETTTYYRLYKELLN